MLFDRSSERPVLSGVKLSNGLMVTIVPVKRMTATIKMPLNGVALSHP
jgi:hypothetical protein